jgi:hypothetical protein
MKDGPVRVIELSKVSSANLRHKRSAAE